MISNFYLAPTTGTCNSLRALALQNAVTHWSLRSLKIMMFIHSDHVLRMEIIQFCSFYFMQPYNHVI